ncbi:MAG: hypothetical protein JWQ35_2259 [Bacteriovoracaceae bacterium]|nr:hypothetical protein [Bacteriovoracaceae bacterium]
MVVRPLRFLKFNMKGKTQMKRLALLSMLLLVSGVRVYAEDTADQSCDQGTATPTADQTASTGATKGTSDDFYKPSK